MYQPCISTAVHSGQQRGVTVTRKPAVSRPIAALPGTGETFGPGLITRRSQVQILPPPPTEMPGQGRFPKGGRPFPMVELGPLSTDLSTLGQVDGSSDPVVNIRRRVPYLTRIAPGRVDVCETRRSHVGSTNRGSIVGAVL
jgi:hypothetical protein